MRKQQVAIVCTPDTNLFIAIVVLVFKKFNIISVAYFYWIARNSKSDYVLWPFCSFGCKNCFVAF